MKIRIFPSVGSRSSLGKLMSMNCSCARAPTLTLEVDPQLPACPGRVPVLLADEQRKFRVRRSGNRHDREVVQSPLKGSVVVHAQGHRSRPRESGCWGEPRRRRCSTAGGRRPRLGGVVALPGAVFPVLHPGAGVGGDAEGCVQPERQPGNDRASQVSRSSLRSRSFDRRSLWLVPVASAAGKSAGPSAGPGASAGRGMTSDGTAFVEGGGTVVRQVQR